MKNKKDKGIVLFFMMGFGVAIMTVMAISAHFINAYIILDSDGQLIVTWKESGLGDNQLVGYLASADAEGYYVCLNRGDNRPLDQNKRSFTEPVSSMGSFSSKNGLIKASPLIAPPQPSPSLNCGSGQIEVLACVTYSGIILKDTTNGISADFIPDSVSKVFYPLPECYPSSGGAVL